jgi:decaprenylphospho-beta-D-erythro-pentofuranosid-2-ulose 2-reductase
MNPARVESIVIMGASSGIAMAAAQRWAAQGSRLYLVARDAQKLSDLAHDLRARGATHVEIQVADLSSEKQVEEACLHILQRWMHIDVLLLAFGILGDQQKLVHDHHLCRRLYELNVSAPVQVINMFRPRFQEQRGGCIAVLSSVAGDRGRASNYVYGSSKAALTAYCSGLKADLQTYGVQVLTIKPGMVATAMTAHLPQGPLMASPQTVARDIVRAVDQGRSVLYTPWFWRWIMLVIKLLPGFIFNRLRF